MKSVNKFDNMCEQFNTPVIGRCTMQSELSSYILDACSPYFLFKSVQFSSQAAHNRKHDDN